MRAADQTKNGSTRVPLSVSFGSFSLVEASRSLFDNGRRVDLPPRYFDLLILLIEGRDGVVTKDDLYERIWRDEIVTEGAIAQGIRHLRRALGDDARQPRFIRTVAKFGYQWIGDLASPTRDAPDPTPRPARADASSIEHVPGAGDSETDPDRTSEARAALRHALDRYASASAGSALADA